MALSMIMVIYAVLGLLAAAGSLFISKKLLSIEGQQRFFGLFLIAIAGFYLAFTAYFGEKEAWLFETAGVIAFAVMGLLAVRVRGLLIAGYLLHGLWDVFHEIYAQGGGDLLGAQQVTEIPLAYGALCAAFDWCIAAYFYTYRSPWSSAWMGATPVTFRSHFRSI